MEKQHTVKKHKIQKIIIMLTVGLFLIISGALSWEFFFSRYYQFQKQESMFLEGARSYYDTYSRYLPKEGETREVTLAELYDNEKVDTLYVPGSKKLCDTDSWVRVYQNKDGKYEYFVNLECNHFKSKVDRKGPEIKLNGEETMIVDYGTEYKDPGVESVMDDTDGKMDIKDVTVDTSKVNTNQPGLYKVTYTAHDKLYNETKIVRKVQVVDKLYSIVKRNTDDTNYYHGYEVNNYVQFSGMTWQIVNVNDDNTVKVMLASNAANVAWSTNLEEYKDSNVYQWLNKEFYSHLTNVDQYIVQDAQWCSSTFVSLDQVPSTCNGVLVKAPVGLLNVSEVQQTIADNKTYIDNYSWLLDSMSNGLKWHVYIGSNQLVGTEASSTYLGVKPVINLKTNLYVNSGDGTSTNPYKLNDYSYAKENEKLKDRLDGEYFVYSGYVFRKIGTDKDGNVHLVMADIMGKAGTQEQLTIAYDENITDKKFNPSEEGNIGYKLNNDTILFLSDKSLVQHSFKIPSYQLNKNYNQLEASNVNAYLAFPTSYELFSGINHFYRADLNYMLLDYAKDSVVFINTGNSMLFAMEEDIWGEMGIKLSLYLKGNLKISSGSGTPYDPYYLK